MAESMDTTEVLADEDDRKLFVGGLPQVRALTKCFLGAERGRAAGDTC